jgi:hypothetical protein
VNKQQPICKRCKRGREACEWCRDLAASDFEAICDCGLHDFGEHLIHGCEQRTDKKFVVAANYDSAELAR